MGGGGDGHEGRWERIDAPRLGFEAGGESNDDAATRRPHYGHSDVHGN